MTTVNSPQKASRSSPKEAGAPSSSVLLPALFIIALALPVSFFIGSARLSPYRFLLMVMVIPCFFAWASGRAGKIRSVDLLMVAYGLWASLSLVVNMGLDAIQPAGMLIIETFGAYFLARCYIRDAAGFRSVVKTLVYLTMLIMPFAAIESITNQPFLLLMISKIMPAMAPVYIEPRMGLRRAQAVFEHPILYGTFASYAFGLGYYVLARPGSFFGRLAGPVASTPSVFFSLSTGAYLAVIVQTFLMIWDLITKKIPHRWGILISIGIALYILVDSLSNRTPFHVFVTYATFSTESAYGRILIFDFGVAQALKTPWFGIGLDQEWERPSWLPASMDNFWLFIAVYNGIPAFLAMAAAFITACVKIGNLPLKDPVHINYRKGVLIAIVGLIFAASTVHFWNATYVIFMFILGSAMWLFDCEPESGAAAGTMAEERRVVTRPRANQKRQPDTVPVAGRKRPAHGMTDV